MRWPPGVAALTMLGMIGLRKLNRVKLKSHGMALIAVESPVIRVGGYHSPYPPSKLEEDYLPDLDRVLDGVDRALAH